MDTTPPVQCAPCSDAPDDPISFLSLTANVLGILTFANSVLLGALLLVFTARKRIVESSDELRLFRDNTNIQFDELKEAQIWLETEAFESAVRGQALKLLDRAQISFIASQRVLERYGKILREEEQENWSFGQFFRKARFAAAKQDVDRATEIRTKALLDFRHFRNRITEAQAKEDRRLLEDQNRKLDEMLNTLRRYQCYSASENHDPEPSEQGDSVTSFLLDKEPFADP